MKKLLKDKATLTCASLTLSAFTLIAFHFPVVRYAAEHQDGGFNGLLILGGAALINPLSFNGMTHVDLGAVLLSSLFILASAYMFKKKQLDRFEGTILILAEIGYMWYLIASI